MHERATIWQAREERSEAARRLDVPYPPHGRTKAGGVVQDVMLAKADDFDAGFDETRIDGAGGGEHDRSMAGAFEADRAVERDLRRSSSHAGVVEHKGYDDGESVQERLRQADSRADPAPLSLLQR
jgi:hypothetical protein